MVMTANEQSALAALAGGKLRLSYGYYRQPNGWITVSLAGETDELRYRREGWEPLIRYGRVEMMSEWMVEHPLEPLFMRGGAGELCEDQIRQMGLYMNPPLIPVCGQIISQYHKHHGAACWHGAQPVVFPQLEQMTGLGPFPCRFCEAVKPTVEARDQHEGVMHKEERSDIRQGETLAASLLAGGVTAPGRGSDTDVYAELLALRAELEKLKRQPAPRQRRQRTVKVAGEN